jgi:ABC-type nitrate/sulfonate/bicarbonate transport system permease component
VAEFFGSEEGLGVIMVRAASSYQVDVVFAGVVLFAALSLLMTSLVKMIENHLSNWRPQHASHG